MLVTELPERLLQPFLNHHSPLPPAYERRSSSGPKYIVLQSIVPYSIVPYSIVPYSIVPKTIAPKTIAPKSKSIVLTPLSLKPLALDPLPSTKRTEVVFARLHTAIYFVAGETVPPRLKASFTRFGIILRIPIS